MTNRPRARCPVCGDDAVPQPSSAPDLGPASPRPDQEWTHPDGSALCLVLSSSGRYQPGTPQLLHDNALTVRTPRLGPPPGTEPGWPAALADALTQAPNCPRPIPARTIGHGHMAARISSFAGPRPLAAEREAEAEP